MQHCIRDITPHGSPFYKECDRYGVMSLSSIYVSLPIGLVGLFSCGFIMCNSSICSPGIAEVILMSSDAG